MKRGLPDMSAADVVGLIADPGPDPREPDPDVGPDVDAPDPFWLLLLGCCYTKK